MSRRRLTTAERLRVITVDLLADWLPYAEPLPEPRSENDWRYFGTITMDGDTGALAWRIGSYGFGRGVRVRELGLWDRIKVDSILRRGPPGHANAPRFTPAPMSVWPANR
jgi:hypothetical protein